MNRTRPTRGVRADETKRPSKRIPLSGERYRMKLDESRLDPDFFYRWVNDTGSDLRKFKDAGYIHVMSDEGVVYGERSVDTADSTSSVVSMDVGLGVTAYLMKQPMRFHEEDVALHNQQVDESEADLKSRLNSGKDGTYGEVKIS